MYANLWNEFIFAGESNLEPSAKCCKEGGVMDECIGLCTDLGDMFSDDGKMYFNLGICETYVDVIRRCQNLIKNKSWRRNYNL